MDKDNKPRSRFKNLDALYENVTVIPSENMTHAKTQASEVKLSQFNRIEVVYEPIDQLIPFRSRPFRLYEGERLDDIVDSIRQNGVFIPIIVRRINSVLEILSGHNRVEASKIAGHAEIPTITLENVADDDALVIVIETNLIQRSFSDMSHSEKAAVLALHHSRLFSQGKRNDILIQLEMLDNPHEHNDNKTCSQVAHKLKSRDVVAKEYGLSKDTVARYLRINRLNLPLKKQLDDGGIAFMSAVILSYLDDAEQKLLADCLAKHNLTVDMKKADMLRKYSEKNRLDSDSIYRILSGSLSHKPIRTPTVKISKAVFVKYFNSNQSAKEIQAIVEKALAMYYEHNETKPSAENSKEATK